MAIAGYCGSNSARTQEDTASRARVRVTNITAFPEREIKTLSHDHDDYDNYDDHDTGARGYARTCARACVAAQIAAQSTPQSTPQADARARASIEAVLPAELAVLYEDVFSRHMPAVVAREIMAIMAAGASADLVAEVLRYTAGAPRPSWAYSRAVLRRQMAMGTRTAEEFAAREAERAENSMQNWGNSGFGKPKRVIEQLYAQRAYDAAEFGELSEEQLAEMAKGGRDK